MGKVVEMEIFFIYVNALLLAFLKIEIILVLLVASVIELGGNKNKKERGCS